MAQHSSKSKKYILLLGVLFLLPMLWILLFSTFSQHHFNTLPYYGPEGIFMVLRDSSDELTGVDDPIDSLIVDMEGNIDHTQFYTLPQYSLTNHLGQPYGTEQLKGKVYLVMFIESESEYMGMAVKATAPVHFKYRGEPDVELVYITNDPATDTVEKLNTFIESVDKNEDYDFISNKWQYLTGDSAAIASIRADGFLIPAIEYSAVLWLVDEYGHLRGKYRPSWDYQFQGSDQLKKAREDIALLKKESDQRKYNARKAQEALED